MSRHPYLNLQRNYTPGRFLAIAVAMAVLAVTVLLMMASSTGEEPAGPPVTPATAGPAVPFVEGTP